METAIVVLGNGSFGRDRVYRIGRRCHALVREAERLAAALPARTVVFSGWSPNGGPAEAEQMRAAWRGADVELVVEPTATLTAENAARTLPLLLERGIERAVVVCAPLHLYRTRFFFSRLYGSFGVETEFRAARIAPTPSALAWELVALTVCRAQLRAARAEIAQNVSSDARRRPSSSNSRKRPKASTT
jgi:uncharacterized SAM-binding protein YcdF (DUF218 family)